jgi:alkylated DNA repair dioxygenase AlkB
MRLRLPLNASSRVVRMMAKGGGSSRYRLEFGMNDQLSLLEGVRRLPDGFRYQPGVVSPAEEDDLVRELRHLPFKNFEFHGHLGKRRVVFYGWRYDFNQGGLQHADPIPSFLLPLRDRAATFAEMEAEQLQHVLVTEYDVGAAIGWHRDKAVFADVIGISFLAPCVFRLRRKVGTKWERASLTVERRSVYLLRGPSRTEWEHSIPAVDALRYSITFRSMREPS